MELQFPKRALSYLRRAAWEIKNDEQTQEIKLSDSFPDIGKILGAWGQPLVRSKEWLSSSMRISGGVMVWILYLPEEGGAPRCVETWIPFQMQWDFPQTQYDGTMRVSCLLKGIDARSVSARKIMVRCVVSAAGEALEPTQCELYQPGEVPEDVQLLRKSYPIRLPTEAGESVITMDEELTPNASCGQIRKIIRCSVQPELIDQKVMADKVVFRGSAGVQVLCECEDEKLHRCDFEIPFSQYAELERDYDPYALADVIPAVTNLELDVQENGTLRLKAGIVGQYVIYDRPVLEVVTDAYSTQRQVSPLRQELALPAVLDMRRELVNVETATDQEGIQNIDAAVMMAHPSFRKESQGFRMQLPGGAQLLGYDSDENPVGDSCRWEKEMEVPADGNAMLLARCAPTGKPQVTKTGVGVDFSTDIQVTAPTDIAMVTALSLGEATQLDPDRPSLILRRVGDDTLWDIAKSCGSTVDSIREANALTDEPLEDQFLLIPIL